MTNTMLRTLPAVLGGLPSFRSPVEVVRPRLPDIEITAEHIANVLRSGRLSNNSSFVRKLESELSEWLGVRNVIAVSNGTMSLILALRALGLQGKVIVPSFTFCATVHAVVWAGLEPVFADIDPLTLNLTPETIAASMTDGVSAVMPVHVFGSPCDVEGIESFAHANDVKVVYDSAQSMGGSYMGRRLGPFGDAESFSLHATKLLPTGEGGVVTTENDELSEKLRRMRNFGLDDDGGCSMIGINAKMCEFPAVLGSLGIPQLDEAIRQRTQCAQEYRRMLSQLPGIAFQEHLPGCESNYQNLVVLVDEAGFGMSRDDLSKALEAENILCRKYFDPGVHTTSAYSEISGNQRPLLVTEYVARRCLCLPLHSDMTDEVVAQICGAIHMIHEHSAEVRNAFSSTVSPIALTGTLRRRSVCIALPSQPKGLYNEMGAMLLDALSDSEYDASLVGDGDRDALDADLLLMIGDCMEFEDYAALLSGLTDRKPATALWLLDTLPPALLNDKAAKIAGRLGLYSRGLRVMRSRLQPIRDLIPLSLRRRIGLSTCSLLLHGMIDAMAEESQLQIRKLDMNSQYEIFGRYEWINRNIPKGWIDHVFVNTVPKHEFLTGMGVPATFVPLGFHPRMGRDLGLERDIDVLFIGELEYGRRKAIVEYLQRELEKRGRSVTVIGSGCWGPARIEMMNRAKISLNVPRFPWDIPTIRVFLSIGCGSLVVSEEMADTAPFTSGRHLVQAGLTDLPDLICHYLEHDDERRAIVEAASDLIHGNLTLSKSLFRVLDSMQAKQLLAA